MTVSQALLDRATEHLGDDPSAAADLAQQVLQQADVAAESSLAGCAWHVLGMAEYTRGRLPQGAAALRQATELLGRHGPSLAECRAWRDLGSALTHLSGDVPAGVQALQRSLALADGDAHERGVVLSRLGPALGRLGRLDEAESALHGAILHLDAGRDRRALVQTTRTPWRGR